MLLYFSKICYEIYYFLLYLIGSRSFQQKESEKSVEEITKELLESIVNQRLEDLELINKTDNGLTLQETL